MGQDYEREAAGETASGSRYIRERAGNTSRIREDDSVPSIIATVAKAGIASVGAIMGLFTRQSGRKG